jgi:hypothetical protein
MTGRYLEDFTVGQTFRSGRLQIDQERIRTCGAEFDPQPFHLDKIPTLYLSVSEIELRSLSTHEAAGD